jgi:hypothetical protein
LVELFPVVKNASYIGPAFATDKLFQAAFLELSAAIVLQVGIKAGKIALFIAEMRHLQRDR